MTKSIRAAVCLLVAVLVFAPSAEAQRPIDFVAGATFSKPSGDDTEGLDSKSGIFVAVGLPFIVSTRFTLTPYVGYIQRGWKDEDESVSFAYIDIPLFFGTGFPLGTSAGFNIGAGPKIGFKVSCQQEDNESGESIDCDEAGNDVKSSDVGLIGGASIGFQASPTVSFAVGGAADMSLSEFSEGFDAKHRTFYLFAALSIVFGGS